MDKKRGFSVSFSGEKLPILAYLAADRSIQLLRGQLLDKYLVLGAGPRAKTF